MTTTNERQLDARRRVHEALEALGALVQTNPEQLVWGTDWPHPQMPADEMPNDGHLLDLFNAWTPEATTRRHILVDNPARLYRFTP